ncbi:hypothetical protein BpHYR1_030960 [Brachionus plicatilis]|uniref:Uncharacterized protein n=1 Tax=Brachionus plicatilis TaxID=10195 RepID=A0A3M7SVZ7_BRAPC|nr:hypothetical protein BpHYR1_030960 [Brachionus plicatilis]
MKNLEKSEQKTRKKNLFTTSDALKSFNPNCLAYSKACSLIIVPDNVTPRARADIYEYCIDFYFQRLDSFYRFL